MIEIKLIFILKFVNFSKNSLIHAIFCIQNMKQQNLIPKSNPMHKPFTIDKYINKNLQIKNRKVTKHMILLTNIELELTGFLFSHSPRKKKKKKAIKQSEFRSFPCIKNLSLN